VDCPNGWGIIISNQQRAIAGKFLGSRNMCVEIFDKSGQLLGYFIPAEDKSIYKNMVEPPPLSEEELQRRENEPGGRGLPEILRDLENRK
jgi:hypothetical protein